MYKAICFGEMLWDVLPGGKVPGGAPMNISLHLHNLGLRSALISRVGDDEAGRGLLEFMEQQQLPTDHIQIDADLPTSQVNVVLGEPEDVFFKIPKPVAWDNIQVTPELVDLVSDTKMFVFGSLAARSEATRGTLLELLDHARVKIFSVNIRPPHFTWGLIESLLKKSDIIKLTRHEFKDLLDWCGKGYYLPKEGLEYLRNRFDLDTLCVTLGREGAIMNRRGEFYEQQGFEIEIVDKVGAGNAFLAAYMHARSEKKHPLDRLTYAAAAGALVCTYPGAVPGISPKMIHDFIGSNQQKAATL